MIYQNKHIPDFVTTNVTPQKERTLKLALAIPSAEIYSVINKKFLIMADPRGLIYPKI